MMKIDKNEELVEHKITYDWQENDFDDIFGMSNIIGNRVKTDNIDFSFYFSIKKSSHAIRVKVAFNYNRVNIDDFGTLELHGDWEFTPGKNDKNVSGKQVRQMKEFFRKYKVLFAAVWEQRIYESFISEYFFGTITFPELLQEFDFYEDYSTEINEILSIDELEHFVRENNIFNMWD